MDGSQWGGSEELWSTTAKQAAEEGHEVYISVRKWPVLHHKLQHLSNAGVKIIQHDYPSFTLKAKIAWRVRKLIKNNIPPTFLRLLKINPDLICVSQGSAFDIVFKKEYCMLLPRFKKPYIIIIQHNTEAGTLFDETTRKLARDVYNRAAHLYFVSSRNRDVAERQLACPVENASIISNPVNITKKGILPWPDDGKLHLACVARYEVNYKGQDVLLQALSHSKWKSRNYVLKLYGQGPDESYLKDLININGLSEKVFLAGHASNINQVWEENHLLILPSLSEGTPLALIEAQLCGRAALATDVGDISRYVNHETGFLVPCCGVNALLQLLEKMWNSKDSLQALGEASFHHANSNVDFTPGKTMLNQFLVHVKQLNN